MATILQLRRGTTVQHSTFTGAVGEVTVDTTKDTVVVHDGTTAGGKPMATEAYVTSAIQTKDNSDEITEGSTNLYFTNTRARAAFSAGTGVTITDGAVAIGQAVGTGSNVTFNDLTVSGNLTVSGTTTTVNTETINLADNIITLNSNEAGTPSQNAGIEVERGTSTNVAFQWNETTDVWEYTVDGTNYIPVVGTTATQTLTNKTISGASNTLSNIGNGSLTNSAITLAGTSVSLGGAFTATNILDAIKTVDGAGSGLDADLLDGNSSAFFRINIYDSAGTLLN
jgi:hypothetical protein